MKRSKVKKMKSEGKKILLILKKSKAMFWMEGDWVKKGKEQLCQLTKNMNEELVKLSFQKERLLNVYQNNA